MSITLQNKPTHIKLGVSKDRLIDFEIYNELLINPKDIKNEIVNQPMKNAMCDTISQLLKIHHARTGDSTDLINFMSDIKIAMKFREDILFRLHREPNNKEVLESYNSYILSLFVA